MKDVKFIASATFEYDVDNELQQFICYEIESMLERNYTCYAGVVTLDEYKNKEGDINE